MTTLKTLLIGQVLLVAAKGTRNSEKVQLEFAEIIKNPNSKGGNGAEGLLNKSDERFSATSARRGWITGQKSDINEMLDIDVSELAAGEVKELNVLNPTINGTAVHVQISETTEGDDWQKANIEKSAKRAGKDGDYIKSNGKFIFSNASIVVGEASHTFLASDSAVAIVAAPAVSQEMADDMQA